VAGEDGVDDLGDDGVVVANDAWEECLGFLGVAVGVGFAGEVAETGDEVVAELVLDGA